ncbi:hypothetical protein Bbelb_255710 [Branchiostoma belcheri]|nr:hypothetical protein Bbelb_255710 [Branchiostoma belcheri]
MSTLLLFGVVLYQFENPGLFLKVEAVNVWPVMLIVSSWLSVSFFKLLRRRVLTLFRVLKARSLSAVLTGITISTDANSQMLGYSSAEVASSPMTNETSTLTSSRDVRRQAYESSPIQLSPKNGII